MDPCVRRAASSWPPLNIWNKSTTKGVNQTMGMKIVAATKNQHKLEELRHMLTSYGIDLVGLGETGFSDDMIEDGATFEENALIKARTVRNAVGAACIADDSGLCVDYLNGAPGIHSARYASDNDNENADDKKNLDKLLLHLKGVPLEQRTAHFVSAIAFAAPDGTQFCVTGRCEGWITEQPRGTGGFGYDSAFYYPPLGKTFGEMEESEKNAVSHRADALKKFAVQYASIYGPKGKIR